MERWAGDGVKTTILRPCPECNFVPKIIVREPTATLRGRVDMAINSGCAACLQFGTEEMRRLREIALATGSNVTELEKHERKISDGLPPQRVRGDVQ